MLLVGLFSAFVVFLASLSKSKRDGLWIRLSFLLIFLFLALRYDYGNDYMAYYYGFKNIRYYDPEAHFEIGWQYLNLIFKPVGFFAMVAFLAAINTYVYYRFILKYVPSEYYWLAVFIYLFNPSFMLIQLSAMRQCVAILLFVLSIDSIYEKNIIKYAFYIVMASLFHTSAMILLLLYLPFIYNWHVTQVKAVILFILYLLMLFLGPSLGKQFFYVVGQYFDRYADYFGGTELNSGLGILYYTFILGLILYYSRNERSGEDLLYKIAIAGYYVLPFSFIVQLAGRVGLYMQPALIAVIPMIIKSIKSKDVRRVIVLSYVAMTLLGYYKLFNSEVFREKYENYKTIFSANVK
ncbi:EpsG family protein [Chlorobaculum sp. 24CR]|uniref:EpsG family protein n=1 Tax=Chlorobaculum sp. 24CR TaxID=2508878 RepID=UPI00100AC273|nr:EpsG family protein [Chlorobaculum sp. 24CR]RXK88058.1 EpsG family protein [Chlorobaculum sp. 24CR]